MKSTTQTNKTNTALCGLLSGLALAAAFASITTPAHAGLLYGNGSNFSTTTTERWDTAIGGLGFNFAIEPNETREGQGLAIGNDGSVYLFAGDFGTNQKIVKYTPGGVRSIFATESQGFRGIHYIALDSTGSLYVAYGGTTTIMKYTPGGVGSVFANAGGGFIGTAPYGIAIDSADNVYVGDVTAGTIQKFSSSGLHLGLFASGLSTPCDMEFDGAGNLLVANAGANNIMTFTPGGVGSVFASASTQALAFDVAENVLYTIENGGLKK